MIEFIEPFNSRLIGTLELMLAVCLFQYALPAVKDLGRVRVFKFWALGFTLGMFGIGRLFGPTYLENNAILFSLGHYTLIIYAALRVRHVTRHRKIKWWDL